MNRATVPAHGRGADALLQRGDEHHRCRRRELLDRLGNLHLVVANGVARLWWRGR